MLSLRAFLSFPLEYGFLDAVKGYVEGSYMRFEVGDAPG